MEEMQTSLAKLERSFMQLQLMGVFKDIKGLILSKPEEFDSGGAPFDTADLLLEIAGTDLNYPVVTHFDCGHCIPMLTIPQLAEVRLRAQVDQVNFDFL
jgi:muramoyltetrapeptide carboxypeptidase